MRINENTIKDLCRKRGWTLNELLSKAGVSRTAYYALTRKDNILPKSIQLIAKKMDVSLSDILMDPAREIKQSRELYDKALKISRSHPGVDVQNVKHTLILLQDTYEDRLKKGILRGKTAHLYQ